MSEHRQVSEESRFMLFEGGGVMLAVAGFLLTFAAAGVWSMIKIFGQ